jgi:hypothetical protein
MKDQIRKSFVFLREKARTQEVFTIDELINYSGWAKKSAEIYTTKKFSGVLKKVGNNFRVDRKFLGVSYARYESLFKQKRKLFIEYEKYDNPDVTVYEFFLPLTLEHVLRQALDELFYKDMVKNRLEQIGIEKISEIFKRENTESDSSLLERVCEFEGKKFGGYSISHVSGRFRASEELLTTEEAKGEGYLIDETTAIARFIIPHEATEINNSPQTKTQPDLIPQKLCIEDELQRTEWLFKNLFVEAVLLAATDQDEIWLLENGIKQKLYRYKALDKDR